MIPSKYNFYIGKSTGIHLLQDTNIDNSSNQYATKYQVGWYASDINALEDNKQIFFYFNFISLYQYNGITFYDKNKNRINTIWLHNSNNSVIIPSSNTKYWAVQFNIRLDANFIAKKDTNFIFMVERIEPHYKELSKKYAKESGQEFFRISMDGKINLFGDDYEIVKQSNLEDQLVFIIDKYDRTTGKYNVYYKGEFNKTDCKFDYDKKKCELKTTAIDDYTEVMNKYENTYDLIKLAPEISKINLHKRSLMQVYIRGANSITNFFGGTYWEDDINEAVDSNEDLINKYYFSYIKAGNEFYVRNAGIPEVNGVYAGTNGYWSQWNGYTCYMGTDTPGILANIYIKRNSDNKILYQSKQQYAFYESDNCFINREDIVMVNVDDPSDEFTIESPFVYHIYRRLLCDVDMIVDSEGVKNTYNLPLDDFVTDNRNYKKCIGLIGGLFFCTSRAVDEPTKYGMNDYGQYFTNQFIPSSTGIGRPLPISRNSWANASLWYVYDDYYEYFEEKLRKQYTLKNSYSIGAAIKAILKKIDPTLSHEPTAEYSQFLYGDTNPLNLDRFYVYITQKTNILKGDYDEPAQKAETSLEELMKMLRDCFRCYWYIEDNKFKIEHIYFFMNGGSYSNTSNYQLDFTKLTDQFNKKLSSYFQSEIEFEKSDLNSRYEFAWMDDVTDLFGGVTIDVKSNYIQKDKTEEINIGQFSSDVDYMLFDPTNFSNDGFALLCPIKSTSVQYTKADAPDNSLLLYPDGETQTYDGFGTSPYLTIPTGSTLIKWSDIYRKSYSQGKHVFGGIGLYNANYKLIAIIGDTFTGQENISPYSNAKFLRFSWQVTQHSNDENFGQPTNANPVITILHNPIFELPIVTVNNLIDENGDEYKAVIQNWYASWIYLQNMYMWDMPAFSLESNVVKSLSVENIKKCMKHTIKFPTEEDLDELKLIKTSIGNGKIDEMSININTRQAKINLLYRPQ